MRNLRVYTTLMFLLAPAIIDKALSFQIKTSSQPPQSAGALQSSAYVDIAVSSAKCPFSSFVSRTSNIIPTLAPQTQRRRHKTTLALAAAMTNAADHAKRGLLLGAVWFALKTRHLFQQDRRPSTRQAPTDIVQRLGDLHSVKVRNKRALRKALGRKLGSSFMYNVFVAITDKNHQDDASRGIYRTFMINGFAPKTGRSVENVLRGPRPFDVKHILDLLSYVQSTAIGFEHIFEDAASGKYNKPEASTRLARLHGHFGIPEEQFIRFLEIIEKTTVSGLPREAYEGDRERLLVGETVGLFNTQYVRAGLGLE